MRVKVRPGAGRRGPVRVTDEGPTIALLAPPERGKANQELVEYFASELGLPRAAISLLHGATGRTKLLRIDSPTPELLARRLIAKFPYTPP
jgi:uncharacterized protein YggU (UPF0235/DUF167 family)